MLKHLGLGRGREEIHITKQIIYLLFDSQIYAYLRSFVVSLEIQR